MKMTDVITVLRAKAPEADLAILQARADLTRLQNLVDDFASVESMDAKAAIAKAVGETAHILGVSFEAVAVPVGTIVSTTNAYKRKFGKRRGPAPDLPGQLVMDVVTQEPIPTDSPLLTAPNCILTPHMAWAPTESRARLLNCVADNIRAFLEGHPQNVVNP